MNKNKLLKSLVGTAALTISLSGVANTYALAAEADNAGGEVNKPASNLVVDNKEEKSQTPDVERQDDGSFDVSFKDKDGNVTEKKNVQLDKADEKQPVENEKADEKAENEKADEKAGDKQETPTENEKEQPAEDEKGENDKSEEAPAEDEKADEKGVDEEAPAEDEKAENDKSEETPAEDEKETPVENDKEQPAEDEKAGDKQETPAENDKSEEVPAEDGKAPAGNDKSEEASAENDKEQPAEDGESEKVGTEPRIVFSVKDGEPLKINVGSTWNPFNHAAAIDSEDGDLTDKIEYEGDVDVQTPGTYEVTYTVTDSDGNEVSEVLTVQVGEGAEEEKGVKDDCNTCDNGGVKVNVDNENTLNGEVKNSGEAQADEVKEENKTEKDEGKGEGEKPSEDPDVDNEGEGEGNQPAEQPEGDEKSEDDESEDDKVTVVENDDNGKGSGEKVYDSSDVTKDQKKGDLPDTGVENTSNAGLIASIGAMFAAMGAFLFGRRKSSDKQ